MWGVCGGRWPRGGTHRGGSMGAGQPRNGTIGAARIGMGTLKQPWKLGGDLRDMR